MLARKLLPRHYVVATFIINAAFAQAQGETASPAFSLARCTELPHQTQMHGSAVVGTRLYVFGGDTPAGYTDRVFSAEITPSGSLGSWKEEAPLPDRRHYISSSVEVVNNRIYLAGGATGERADTPENQIKLRNDVLWTHVQPNGELAPWKSSEPFPGLPRANMATCSTSANIYVLGGNGSRKVEDLVLVADFQDDGAPVRWREAGKLPLALWFHGAAILEGRLYTWGGLNGLKPSPVNERVFSFELLPDGTLGPWREETPMPVPIYSAAFCGFNDYLICVAGRMVGGISTEKIWFTRLEDGKVGAWQSLSTDLETRVFHALGLDRAHGRLYITGGQHRSPTIQKNGPVVKTVQAFQLGTPGGASHLNLAGARPASSQEIRSLLQSGKRVLLYFRSPQVPAVGRFEENVLRTPEFSQLTSGYEVRTVDSSRDQSLCYEYSVFQVPSFVLLTPTTPPQRSKMLRTLEDVKTFLQP